MPYQIVAGASFKIPYINLQVVIREQLAREKAQQKHTILLARFWKCDYNAHILR